MASRGGGVNDEMAGTDWIGAEGVVNDGGTPVGKFGDCDIAVNVEECNVECAGFDARTLFWVVDAEPCVFITGDCVIDVWGCVVVA